MNEKTIAIAGNPNVGKTTVFNMLTGSRYKVANYPGVTVEKKVGNVRLRDKKVTVVDLPGTYTLSPQSMDEVIARNYIVEEKPEAVIDVMDASNLSRNLYLAVQMREMGVNLLIALNMADVAESLGLKIDTDLLGKYLGASVVTTVARDNDGLDALKDAIDEKLQGEAPSSALSISYGADVDTAKLKMTDLIETESSLLEKYSAPWIALKYLEQDESIMNEGSADPELHKKLIKITGKLNSRLKGCAGCNSASEVIAEHRYKYISDVLAKCVQKEDSQAKKFITDKIDLFLTNKIFGPVFMLLVLWGVYQFTFWASEFPVLALEYGIEFLGDAVSNVLGEGLLQSLIVSGIIDGVGAVIGFVPLILFMFAAITVLEDSGYMSRISYMTDKIFSTFKLQGNSAVSFIVSGGIAGGCAVPGIMAARSIKGEKERLLTILTAPFMPCGAKLPVYALLINAFFSSHKGFYMMLITILSWSIALMVAFMLGAFVKSDKDVHYISELPLYRLPTIKSIAVNSWERCWMYIKKAGTVILFVSIVLWVLLSFPSLSEDETIRFDLERVEILGKYTPEIVNGVLSEDENLPENAGALQQELSNLEAQILAEKMKRSAAGRVGTFVEPVTQYAGFDWRTNIALIAGIAAKEVIISTLGTTYSMGEIDDVESESETRTLRTRLQQDPGWSKATALSILIFTMLYSPCFVAVTMIFRETRSLFWAVFTVIGYTAIALFVSTIVYQLLS